MRRNNAGGNVSRGQRGFSQVPSPTVPRSVFNRDSQLMTGLKAGNLVPVFRDEATPGDTVNMNASFFGRLNPMIRPIMSGLYLDVFFFAVPHRLVWENWQKMHGEQANPGDSTDFLAPVVTNPGVGGFGSDSVYDFMGLPPDQDLTGIQALYFRAYNLIYNEWFRDETLIDSVPVPVDDGPDAYTDYTLLKRGKRQDYFTSSNPFVQKGNPVELPLGTSAPIVATGNEQPLFKWALSGNTWLAQAEPGNLQNMEGESAPTSGSSEYVAWSDPKLEADLSSATSATVNELREAIALQQVLEKDARGGTRYTEMIRAHFGVTSPDARLQRPELLGMGTLNLNPHAVASTFDSGIAGGQPVGALGAFGTMSGNVRFTKSFTEHTMIIGIGCLRSDLLYQQGVHRDFTRRERFDWPLPGLAHLGEQPIFSREIYADGSASDDDVFGYQERYAERRYKPSEITGIMRSSYVGAGGADTTQDVYHLAQDFGTRPVLNQSFIEEDPPMNRVMALTDSPELLVNAWYSYKHAQPLPVYGVPGLNRL